MIKKLLNIASKNSNQLMVLLDQALVSGVNFLMAVLIARFLGLESFGLFAFGWMLVLFISSIQLAFIISPLFTLYPKHQAPEKYIAAAHTIQLLFSMVTVVICAMIVYITFIYKPEWRIDGIIYSLPIVAGLFVLQDFYRRINFATKKPVRSLISDSISYGAQPIAITLLYYFDALTINTIFFAMSGLYIISIIYNAIKVKSTYNIHQIKNTITENWSFSKYLVGTAFLQWFSGNFFIIVAGGLLGPIAIGAIRIVQNVVGVLHVLFSAMGNIVPIKGAEILSEKGAASTIQYFKKILLQGGLITIIVLTLIALGRTPIIELFYGVEYLEYVNLLLGFTGVYVLVFIGTILGFVIRTFELNNIFFWSYITTTLFSLITAKTLIIHMGIYGVLMGLLITQFINISFYVLKLNFKLKTLWK